MKGNVSKRGPKVIVGIIVLVMLMMSFSTLAFAETGKIQDKTITIKTMDAAKTTMADIQKTDIKCNLTIKCASQEIVDYVKKELEGKPLACLYNSVKVLLDTTVTNGNCNTNNNCNINNNCNQNQNCNQNKNCNSNGTVGTSKDKDQSVTLQSNGNNCKKNTTNNCSKDTTTCDKNTKDCNKSTTVNSNMDASPKTGDSTNIYVLLVCGALAAITAVTTLVIKKRRA